MKKPFRLIVSLFVLLGLQASPLCAQDVFLPSPDVLSGPFGAADAARFGQPDRIFYPEVWIECMCGNLSEKGITADLEAIAEAGFNGVQLFFGNRGTAWPGVEQIRVLSPQWEAFVAHASREAERLGLRFTLQNCAGWAMAGGPWIEPADAMRHLVMTRKDVNVNGNGNRRSSESRDELAQSMPSRDGGKDAQRINENEDENRRGRRTSTIDHQLQSIDIELPVEAGYLTDWRDYRDVAVLAFPTPEGDTGEALVTRSAEGNDASFPWHSCLEGQGGGVLPPTSAEAPHTVLITLPEPENVRTVVLSSVQAWNHAWCYEPGVHVTVEALTADGAATTVFDDDMPQSCWQDEMNISLACAETAPTATWRVSIVNSHHMALSALRLLSAARKNNWEFESARTLRALMPESNSPSQSSDAYVDSRRVMDLTASLDENGHLHAQLPEGHWTILRLGHVNTGKKNAPAPPEATGFECNKYSAEAAHKHFDGYIGHLTDGPLAGGGLDGMLLDSWECEYQTWTADMEEAFRQLHGYDLRRYLPALFGWVTDDPETTSRFLDDWRALINRLTVDRFYGEIARLGHERGLSVTYETAAGDVFPGDIMEYFRHADIPMCEFWSLPSEDFVGTHDFKPIRPTASAAHLYGKPRVAVEAFTSMNTTWDEQFSTLRDIANRNLIEGATYFVCQAYTHNPRPDELVPGTSFGDGICTPFLRTQTWWRHVKTFNDCLARTTYLLERGRPVADVLWYLGDELDHKPDQDAPFPEGFCYDYCNPDILMHRLSVRDGRLVTPEGLSYRVLWLPRSGRMLPETLERILTLVQEGAIIVGDAPLAPATLADAATTQQRFDAAVEALWGDVRGMTEIRNDGNAEARNVRHVGKGQVISGVSMDEALTMLDLQPDVISDSPMQWLHREVDGADWYYVCPVRGGDFDGVVRFRSTGVPELWDPVDGRVHDLTVLNNENGRMTEPKEDGRRESQCHEACDDSRFISTKECDQRENNENSRGDRPSTIDHRPQTIALKIPYAGGCFVVFRHDIDNDKKTKAYNEETIPVNGSWTLTFPSTWGSTPLALSTDTLRSWTEMDIPDELRAYSGTVRYQTTFSVRSLRKDVYLLDLGGVEQIARVTVNGETLQTLWMAPYQLDITSALHRGENTLEVEVTNTWFNRLVHDARLPESERATWTSNWPSPDAPLRPSGLLGPVQLIRKTTK